MPGLDREPLPHHGRRKVMTSMLDHLRRPMLTLVVLATVGVAACGSDDPDEPEPTVTDAASDVSAPSDADPTATTGSPPPSADAAGGVIGTGNVGGPVVDAQPHPIDGIDIAESYPEQLIVRFTSGDPNCTAADATASVDGDRVVVSLVVGITEDALTRSCLAGDVEQSVTISLDEGLDGRDVVPA